MRFGFSALLAILAVFGVVLAPSAVAQGGAMCSGQVATITGSGGDDNITGTPGDDVIVAFAGNDIIDGLGGNDVICGGRGDDVIVAGSGADIVLGGDDDDTIYGGSGADVLNGLDDDDIVYGGAGDDVVSGADGDDILFGDNAECINLDDLIDIRDQLPTLPRSFPHERGCTPQISGDDRIMGGQDQDVIDGEEGSDVIFGGNDADVISGGLSTKSAPDADQVFAGASLDADFIQGAAVDFEANGGPGDDRIFASFITNAKVRGESGDDFLSVDGAEGGDVSVLGGTGNDRISIFTQGETVVFGGDGHDSGFVEISETGFVTFYGGTGDDSFVGSEFGNDADRLEMIAFGGPGNDVLASQFGSSAADLYGGSGDDELYNTNGLASGQAGNDLLWTSNGTLLGGAGDDRMRLDFNTTVGVARGGPGNDQLSGSGILDGGADDDQIYATNDAILNGRDGVDSCGVEAGVTGDERSCEQDQPGPLFDLDRLFYNFLSTIWD